MRATRDALVPPQPLRFRTQPLRGHTAMHLSLKKNPTPAPCRVISSGLLPSQSSACRVGDPDGLLGSRKAEIRSVTPGTWCLCTRSGRTLRMAFRQCTMKSMRWMGDSFWQLGAVNLWRRRSLGVSSDCLVLFANVPQSVAKVGW